MTSHRSMSREAIAARYERVRQILLKEPDLPRCIIEERTGCNGKVITQVLREIADEKRLNVPVVPKRAMRLHTLEQQVAALGDRVTRLEGPSSGMVCIDGEELRRVRRASGWTMAKMSELVGVNASTWCNWERGQYRCRGDTALRVLEKLHALGVPLPEVQ